ncbi:MAG: hypothetical protein Q4A52_04295 [Bacillota bacterium]|nr:hypothetical protein [Bacillota bacterium]
MVLSGHPTFLHVQEKGKTPVGFSDVKLQNKLSALRRAIVNQINTRSKPTTIAAHATADLDENDMEEIHNFIDYMKSKKKK